MADELRIVIDDGRRRVPIVNLDGEEVGAFYFMPTDIGIIQRLRNMEEEFKDITKPLENVHINPDGTADVSDEEEVAILQEAENRLYAAMNKVLNADVASAFFASVNPFSKTINGDFYCLNVVEGIAQFINKAFDKSNNTRSKNIEKYTKRYKK